LTKLLFIKLKNLSIKNSREVMIVIGVFAARRLNTHNLDHEALEKHRACCRGSA